MIGQDALHPDTVAQPPRHHADGQLCVQALITEDCWLNHDYDRDRPMSPLEYRLVYLEVMVEEVAALRRESKILTFEVDDISRDDAGRIHTIFGTKVEWIHEEGAAFHRWDQHPYIIGEV